MLTSLVCIFASFGSIYANEFYHLITTRNENSDVKIEGIFIQNQRVTDVVGSGLILSENGIQRNISSIENLAYFNENEDVNILFVIDFSTSMKVKNYEIIKQTFSNISNDFNFEKTKVGIIGFSNVNFLIHDFTANVSEISNSLNNLFHIGVTNLDTAFFGSPAGAVKMFENHSGRKEIIIISDGSETGNSSTIINLARENDMRIHSITMDFPISKLLQNITLESNGFSFDKINNSESLEKSVRAFFHIAKISKPNSITYKSLSCEVENTVNLNFANYGISRNINITFEKDKLPKLLVEPSYHYFGLRLPPQKPEIKIKLSAKNGDIKVDGFIENEFFKVVSTPKSFEIKNGESREITIQFEPKDSNYIYEEIKFISNQCSNNLIRLAGGSDRFSEINKTIRVINPNGREHLISGSYYEIDWDGVLPTDTVRIDYSTNKGNTWLNITNSATGLRYRWQIIPNTFSNNCLIRVSQLSKYDLSKNIISLKGMQGSVVNLKWRTDRNELYTAGTDGFIRLWNVTNGEPIRTIAGNINQIIDFDLSPDFQFFTYLISGDNKAVIRAVDDEFEQFTLTGLNDELLKIVWNPVNNFIASGSSSGNLYLWDFPSIEPVSVKQLNSRVISLNWSNDGSKLVAGLQDGNTAIFSPETGEITFIKASDQRINSAVFNPSGSVIITSSMNEIIRVWDIQSETNITNFINDLKPVNVLSWDPTARFIASASVDSTISLWQPGTGNLFYTFKGHNNLVNNIKWRNDGKLVASSTIQGEVFIWSVDDIPFSKPTLQYDESDFIWSIVNPNLQTKGVSFRQLRVNDAIDSTVSHIIFNQNNFEMVIDTILVRGGSNSFSLTGGLPQFPYILKPNAGINLKVLFEPQSIGSKIDTIIYLSGLREYRSILTGFADERLVEINPVNHNFGVVKLGTESDEFTFQIKNISKSSVFVENFNELKNTNGQFIVKNFSPKFLEPEEIYEISLTFNPNQFFMSGAVFDVIYDGKLGADLISVSGIGAAPQISYEPEINFTKLICSDIAVQDIKIRNIGNELLKINNIQLSENSSENFSIDLSNTNFNINEGDSTYLRLIFSGDVTGNFLSEIVIDSEINADQTTRNTIKADIIRGKIDFGLYPPNLSFYLNETGTESTKEITIINQGTEAISWVIPNGDEYFEVESINPMVTAPGDSAKVLVKFLGAETEGLYNGKIGFVDSCKQETVLNLTAYIGPNNAFAEILDVVNFPDMICEKDTLFFDLSLKNSGTTPLIINNYSFENISESFFLNSEIMGKTLNSNEEINIRLSYFPNNSGKISGNFRIFTNAANYESGVIVLELNGFFGFADFEFSEELITISGLIGGEETFIDFDIYNSGNLPLNWQFDNPSEYFSIESINPQITNPGELSKVRIRFNGGEQGKTYTEMMKLKNICGTSDSIEIIVNVDGFAKVQIKAGNIIAAPGDKVNIPIYLSTTDGTELPDIAGYKAILSFNSTLLVPVNESNSYVKDTTRILQISLPAKPINSDGLALNIECIATLGNSEETEILITGAIAKDMPELKITTSNGNFTLDSLCFEGGVRLISGNSRLWLGQNSPNPIDDFIKIKFSVIEYGVHKILIYDLFGREVKKIFDMFIAPGEYEVSEQLNDLAIGNYFYVLKTPTTKISRKMTVNR